MNRKLAIFLGFALFVLASSAFAGSAVIGSVAGSMNATIDGQRLMPKTTIFSGDSLQVKEGAAVVAVGSGSRLVLGRDTMASFLREGTDVTVLLGQGNVSVYQGQAGVSLRVKVGSVTVQPTGEFKTLGEVAMLNGAVVVTAKEGKLRVESNGAAQEVVKGKTVTVAATRPARAPQGGSGSAGVSGSTAMQVASVAAGATSAVLSGVAMSRAGGAKDAANAANDTLNSVVRVGPPPAQAAAAAANALGCAINMGMNTSAYKPPTGFSCDEVIVLPM
jgi:hypothetical protein